MGCFDTIIFDCPSCGYTLYAQSKSGDCLLFDYYNTSVPLDVAINANRHAPFICECGKKWMLEISNYNLSSNLVSLNINKYKENTNHGF